jgi:GT2 family glycosyltransferase
LTGPVYFAFATGPQTATAAFLERVAEDYPESTMVVASRQRPSVGEWVEVRAGMGSGAIAAACRRAMAGRPMLGVAIHATRGGSEWRMRMAALRIAGRDLRIYNDGLDHFRLGDVGIVARHLKWRWRGRRRGVLWWKLLGRIAVATARHGGSAVTRRTFEGKNSLPGISLIVPSRDGRDLLESMLPAVMADLEGQASEVIVVDNGSRDGTTAFLGERYPEIRVEWSELALSFAEAVNRGIAAARYSHVVLLNNDMQIEPGFFPALRCGFERVPDLFCATAQIFFPEGQRREETGLCFWAQEPGDDFPVYCAEPRDGEDGTLVLYGSGGCSMYDAAKLRELGGFDEVYRPAYVEDLDIGYRGWMRGWPTVFCAGAKVEHRHRATTSRYYAPEYLDYLVERNYLRFLVRATGEIFEELWGSAIERLERRAASGDRAARRALREAWREGMARASQEGLREAELKRELTR